MLNVIFVDVKVKKKLKEAYYDLILSFRAEKKSRNPYDNDIFISLTMCRHGTQFKRNAISVKKDKS